MNIYKEICQQNLFPNSREKYGERYQDHVMEQYRLYIESINYVSDLKHRANSYLLTINTVLLTAAGLSLTKEEFFNPAVWHTVVPAAGLLLSFAWWYTTHVYKQINRVKFRILHCIEAHMPFAPYTTEWKIVEDTHSSPRKYPSEKIEPLVPWIFATLYLLIFFFIRS
ncbi:MAG: hypothetical protein Q7S11_00120 [bacterium]|nr:hypothetical protein [bacterium]